MVALVPGRGLLRFENHLVLLFILELILQKPRPSELPFSGHRHNGQNRGSNLADIRKFCGVDMGPVTNPSLGGAQTEHVHRVEIAHCTCHLNRHRTGQVFVVARKRPLSVHECVQLRRVEATDHPIGFCVDFDYVVDKPRRRVIKRFMYEIIG